MLDKNETSAMINELADNMDEISLILYTYGAAVGDIKLVVKASTISVLSEILKDDTKTSDFHDFLKYYTSRRVVEQIKPSALVDLFTDELPPEFKDKVSAFEAYKEDFEELGEKGLIEFKERFKKNNPNFDIDGILGALGKE